MTAVSCSERGRGRRVSTVLLISLVTQSDLLLPERGSSCYTRWVLAVAHTVRVKTLFFLTTRGHCSYAQRFFLILQTCSWCTTELMTAVSCSERGRGRRVSTVLLISLATQSDLLLPERGSSRCATYPMGTCSRRQCACQTRTSIRCLPDDTRPLQLRAAVVSDTDACSRTRGARPSS